MSGLGLGLGLEPGASDGGGTPPHAGSHLLLEDGFHLLLEDGSLILLES